MASSKPRLTIADIVAFDVVDEQHGASPNSSAAQSQASTSLHVRSRNKPVAMGNDGKIAYGGCAIAFAVHAAFAALPKESNARIYSVQDFVVEVGNKTMLTYSASPLRNDLSHHSKLLESEEQYKTLSRGAGNILKSVFRPMNDIAICKPCPQSILAQNAMGYLTEVKTTQDSLPLTDRTSYDWLSSRTPFASQSAVHDERAYDACFLAFVMDGALSFVPLAHTNQWIGTRPPLEACSSLDFSLRFHLNDLPTATRMYIRELRTIVGRHERTYTESRLFQEQPDRSMVLAVTMTQQSVLRGQPSSESHL